MMETSLQERKWRDKKRSGMSNLLEMFVFSLFSEHLIS